MNKDWLTAHPARVSDDAVHEDDGTLSEKKVKYFEIF
jgi:hypothetical protein